jgi:hypothetical protein
LHDGRIKQRGVMESLFRAKAAKFAKKARRNFPRPLRFFAAFARHFQNGLAMISNGGHNLLSILN